MNTRTAFDNLYEAVGKGKLSLIDKCLKKVADPADSSNFPKSLLAHAANLGNLKVLQHLLTKVEFKSKPLPADLYINLLECKDLTKRSEIIKWLLQSELALAQGVRKEHLQAVLGDTSVIMEKIEKQPRDDYGLTPLHHAVLWGYEVAADKQTILDKALENINEVIPAGFHNKGATIPLLLAAFKKFNTLHAIVIFANDDVDFDLENKITNLQNKHYDTNLIYHLKSNILSLTALVNRTKKKIPLTTTNLSYCSVTAFWDIASEFDVSGDKTKELENIIREKLLLELLERNPDEVIDPDVKGKEYDKEVAGCNLLWLLARAKQWDLINEILRRNPSAKVDLGSHPRTNDNNNADPLIDILLKEKQFDILKILLTANISAFVPAAKKYYGKPVHDYLLENDQQTLSAAFKARESLSDNLRQMDNACKEQEKKGKEDFLRLKKKASKKLHALIKDTKNVVPLKKIQLLIEELGADPNFVLENMTVISAAAKRGRIDIIQYLVEKYNVELSSCSPHVLFYLIDAPVEERKKFYNWLLQEKRYEEIGHGVTQVHVRAALGEVLQLIPVADNLGLTPYHYSVLSGLACSDHKDELIELLETVPEEQDNITSGSYIRANLPLVLTRNCWFDTLNELLDIYPNRVYKLNAEITNIISKNRRIPLLYDLVLKQNWDLCKNLWRRNVSESVLNSSPGQILEGDEEVKLSFLLLATKVKESVDFFEEIVTHNSEEVLDMKETIDNSPNRKDGISIAWLLAHHQKWELLEELFDRYFKKYHKPLNVSCCPNKLTFPKKTLKELLIEHGQHELLAKIIGTKGQSLKTSQDDTITDQEKIKSILADVLKNTLIQIVYSTTGEGKKKPTSIDFELNIKAGKATEEEVARFKKEKENFRISLQNAAKLIGNKNIKVDGNGRITARSEGIMHSFVSNKNVIAILKGENLSTNNTSSYDFVDLPLQPVFLTKEEIAPWKKSLLPAFGGTKSAEDIEWNENDKCFIVALQPDRWKGDKPKSNIGSKLNRKLKEKFARVEFNGEHLKITPCVHELPLMPDLHQSVYKKIDADEENPKDNVPKKTEGPPSASPKSNPVIDYPYAPNADGFRKLLRIIANDEKNQKLPLGFLRDPREIHKDGKLKKLVFKYTYTGAPFIDHQDSLVLLQSFKVALDTLVPNFIKIYRDQNEIKIVLNLEMIKAFNQDEINLLRASFTQALTTKPNEINVTESSNITSPQPVAANNTTNIVGSEKKKKKKKKKKKATEQQTEGEVFETLKGPASSLSTNKQANVKYHLKQLKSITIPFKDEMISYAYLLHVIRILGILSSGDIKKDSIFWQFRNVMRHAINESLENASCTNFCKKVEPLMKILFEYFDVATITSVPVTVFAPNKSTALEEIQEALKPFATQIEEKTLGEDRDKTQCVNTFREKLASIPDKQLSTDEKLNYKWKRDATLELCSLIYEITKERAYADIYIKVGHEFEIPYKDFADELYQKYLESLQENTIVSSSESRNAMTF